MTGAGASGQRQRLGRYVIEAELGRGGMGVVYRAFDPGLGRTVAIKLVADPARLDARGLERFLGEGRAAARLSHPGLVGVHEVGQDPAGRPFLVMDFVDGPSVEAHHTRERLPPRAIADVARQVAEALEHAHGHGIIHRDVKPQNVLLERTDGATGLRARLCDLGLARELDRSRDLTATGQLLGTPGFMAPEQIRGEAVAPTVDVFGLGALLYWLLVRRPPFDGDSVVVVLRQVLSVDPTPPRTLDAGVHPDLETIALRCLEKEPERRYASAAEVAAELQRFLDGEPIHARPIGATARAARWVRRNRLLSLAVGSAVAAILVAAVVVAAARLQARGQFVADLAARARISADAFEAAAAEPVVAATSDRHDRLLALGLDAVGDARAWLAAAPTSAAARRLSFDLSMATGEVAIAAEQWSVAAGAFDRAVDLDVDALRARQARRAVESARDRVAAEHREAVLEVLEGVRSGDTLAADGGREAALFEIVRHPGEETTRLLCAQLDRFTTALGEASLAALLAAEEPTPDEARAGAERLVGLPEAARAWLGMEIGEQLDAPDRAVFEAARRRLEVRAARGRTTEVGSATLELYDVLATAQLEALGRDRLATAALCLDALGWLGRADGIAVDAVGRYLAMEMNQIRAIPAGRTLARLGGAEAIRWLRASRNRFGLSSAYWRTVSGRLPPGWAERPGVPGGASSSADGSLIRGDALFEQGLYREAIEAYDRAIELDPVLADAWHNRGNAKQKAGDLPGALADYDRSLELDPDEPVTWQNRGNAREEVGDLEGAVADFDRALELDPRMAHAFNGRGNVRRSLGDRAGALADLDRAIELDPGMSEVWNNRGLLWLSARDFERAIADFDQAIELDPDDATAWINRGNTHFHTGDRVRALADFDHAIALAPKIAEAWNSRGYTKRLLGDLDGALRDLDRAVTLDPDHVNATNNRGLVRHALGDFAGAIDDFSRTLELSPRHDGALANRGSSKLAAGDAAGALADLDRSIELAPADASTWSNRGSVRQALGDTPGAIADLDRAIALLANEPSFWNNRAGMKAKLGDLAGAIADYDRAVELAPKEPNYLLNRGEARYRMGDVPEALADLDRGLRIAPRHVMLLRSRGRLRVRTRDYDGALEDYDRVLEIEPRDVSSWHGRGMVRLARRDLAGALADQDRAIELDPDAALLWTDRAHVKMSARDPAGALRDTDRAIELEPTFAKAWVIRGLCRSATGDRAGAIEALERALELDPNGADADGTRRRLEALRAGG